MTFLEFVKAGRKIDAIRLLRQETPDVGLRDAKLIVEFIEDNLREIDPPKGAVDGGEIIALLKADKKIPAIKLFQQGVCIGLKEAKYMVDTLEQMTLHNEVYEIVRNLRYCKPHDPVAIKNARERLLVAFDEQFPQRPSGKRVFVYHGPHLTNRYSFYVEEPDDINFQRIIKELEDGSKVVVVTIDGNKKDYMGAALLVKDNAPIPYFIYDLGSSPRSKFGYTGVTAYEDGHFSGGSSEYPVDGLGWRALGINLSDFEKLQSAMK